MLFRWLGSLPIAVEVKGKKPQCQKKNKEWEPKGYNTNILFTTPCTAHYHMGRDKLDHNMFTIPMLTRTEGGIRGKLKKDGLRKINIWKRKLR